MSLRDLLDVLLCRHAVVLRILRPRPLSACGDYYAHGEHAHQPLYFPPASYPLFDPHIFLGQSPLSPPALVLPPYDDSRYSDPFPSLSSTYEDYPPQHGQHEPPNESTPLIHSPIPVSAYSTLLAHVEYASQESSTSSPKSPQAETLHESSQDVAHSHPTIIALSPAPEHPPLPPAFDISEDGDLKSRGTVEPYTALHATFPTPSELLNGLMQDKSEASAVSGAHVPVEVLDACQLSDPPSPPSQPAARARNRARIPSTLRPAQPGKPENLRKGYFRSVADNVGFQPTDPDTVTSHDKKRHYLECLEQYILWLHDQIGLAGHAPSRLERIDSYRGLNSPTIRAGYSQA
ncbi:uncharacterized protein PHACADRAFT_190331 [Phanerochaete carnosa HHB-10118-sp]|uniref:Uncharacterized protein n=1 Tax=Phanerochaete carnosa (strain HHB-10118-sp) TaxID=650164 RepID=K5WB43_PHACS|nr:uncharacterized protein PHACADRAFT_190331 [Phanerochaete carnosa HHB-10118-sp]EKM61183.1 hypothetical protein PHACADRAFT_190331 [Phanerochaete carnosa HHB-10118-sp]